MLVCCGEIKMMCPCCKLLLPEEISNRQYFVLLVCCDKMKNKEFPCYKFFLLLCLPFVSTFVSEKRGKMVMAYCDACFYNVVAVPCFLLQPCPVVHNKLN